MKKRTAFSALALCVLTAGCATPLVHITNQVFNFGQELPADMVNRHVAGMVAFDEDWPGAYNKAARTALYGQGVGSGTAVYGLRVARINLANTESALFKSAGELSFATGAIVPDHLPRLRAYDVVEIRQTGSWRTMEQFASSGEGNIVVRIVCRKGDLGYVACVERAPRIGKAKGVGETHTPYPASVAAYGFTFSPRYDATGGALRPWPAEPR